MPALGSNGSSDGAPNTWTFLTLMGNQCRRLAQWRLIGGESEGGGIPVAFVAEPEPVPLVTGADGVVRVGRMPK